VAGLAWEDEPTPTTRADVAIELCAQGAQDRQALERYIAEAFARHHGARLSSFLPWLLGTSRAGTTTAALGLRPAGNDSLFLERYLDEPAEQAISRHVRTPVARDGIVEIGNLAASDIDAGRLIFTLLPALLHEAGFRWMIFTATRPVARLIKQLHFSPRVLCRADPDRLGADAAQWGRYYDHQPQVMAGDLGAALSCTRDDAWMSAQYSAHAATLTTLSARLRAGTCP
jgi:hypothetical protein